MNAQTRVGTIMLAAGATTALVGLAVLAAVDPLVGGIILLVGLSDIVIGFLFRAGTLGRAGQTPAEEAAEDELDAPMGTTADGVPIVGDANPYARED